MVNYFWNLDFIILKWLVWLLTRNHCVCLMDKQNRIDFICKFKIVGIGKKINKSVNQKTHCSFGLLKILLNCVRVLYNCYLRVRYAFRMFVEIQTASETGLCKLESSWSFCPCVLLVSVAHYQEEKNGRTCILVYFHISVPYHLPVRGK